MENHHHLEHLNEKPFGRMPFAGRASFMGPNSSSTASASISALTRLQQSQDGGTTSTDVSRMSSQLSHSFMSRPGVPLGTSPVGTPQSISGYQTARLIPPSGMSMPNHNISGSAPFFEDTISSMVASETQSHLDTLAEGDLGEDGDCDAESDLRDEKHTANGNIGSAKGETLDQMVSKIFDTEKAADLETRKINKVKVVTALSFLIAFTASCIVLSSFPVFSCNHTGELCLAPVTIRLTDKTESAKSTMQTIREALKVLTYIVIDFGDTHGDSDKMSNRMEDYYHNNVIDSFDVNTVYDLNILGYCRTSENGSKFCMRSYGFDLISVFIRDAGVQLGELTKTNVGIMGDSFAMLYELAIAGFNELVIREDGEGEYVDHAILLQKFSKGMGFMSVTQLVIDCVLLIVAVTLLTLVLKSKQTDKKSSVYTLKKMSLIMAILLSFLGITTALLVLSFTNQFYVLLSDLTTAVGIAEVVINDGFALLWFLLLIQVIVTTLVVYVANCFRKDMF